MIFAGVDSSKCKHHCCIINELGEVVQAEFSFENTRGSFGWFQITLTNYRCDDIIKKNKTIVATI